MFVGKQAIPRCFGAVDNIFAGHPSDEQAAKELRKQLVTEGVSYSDFSDAVIAYLHRKGCSHDHIEEQMKEVSKMYETKMVP